MAGPQEQDQPSLFGQLVRAHNAQIWTALVLIGIELAPVQNGGYLRAGVDQP